MPLDPDARAFVEAMRNVPQPYETTIEEFRAALSALVSSGFEVPVKRVETITVPGGSGQDLAVRLYVPDEAEPLPVLVWLHGGSFTRGTLETFDAARRWLAIGCGVIVAAVDQRLSPEARFPAPLEDAYAATAAIAACASRFGGDPGRLGVGGESSGGNLAAATTLLARQRGGPRLALQVLLMPLLDAACDTPSIAELGDDFILTRRQLAWAYEQYAPGRSLVDPLLSPLREPDLSGLPPAVVVTVEYDPVRDEGERYAERLAAAGVPVRAARIDGMVHHFPGPSAGPLVARLVRETLNASP